MIDLIPLFIVYLLTGTIAGFLAGLLGIGGGAVIIPVLFFTFQALGIHSSDAMLIATATSMAIILPTSLSSVYRHYSHGNVDIKLILRWLVFIWIGVGLGVLLSNVIGGQWLMVVFAGLIFWAAINVFWVSAVIDKFSWQPPPFLQSLLAFPIGLLSTLVGVGGGTLTVPILLLSKYSIHRAIGTSAGIGFLIAIPGAILYLLQDFSGQAPWGTVGKVNLPALICIGFTAVLLAPVGAIVARRTNAKKLKKIFAIFLVIVSARMLYSIF